MRRETVTFIGWKCLSPFASLQCGTSALGPAPRSGFDDSHQDFNYEAVYTI